MTEETKQPVGGKPSCPACRSEDPNYIGADQNDIPCRNSWHDEPAAPSQEVAPKKHRTWAELKAEMDAKESAPAAEFSDSVERNRELLPRLATEEAGEAERRMTAEKFWNEYCLTEDGETSDWPLGKRMMKFAEAFAVHENAALREEIARLYHDLDFLMHRYRLLVRTSQFDTPLLEIFDKLAIWERSVDREKP
jgi:hypothetical protein